MMRQKGTRLLFDYWNALRGDRQAPNRSEIAPAALGRSLAHVFILDAGASPARFRIAGTWIGNVFGQEWTGAPFSAMFDRDDHALVGRLTEAVAAESVVVTAELHAAAEEGREADLELVLLPLADDPVRLIGSVHACRDAFWLGAYPLAPAHLTSVRLMDPGRPLFDLAARPAIPIAKRRNTQPARSRRILRVIEGGAGDESRAHPSPVRPALRLIGADQPPADRG